MPPLRKKPYCALNIPKVVIQFWDDLSTVPKDVRACLDSWKPLIQKGFKRIIFDDHTAGSFIREQLGTRYAAAFGLCRHPCMRSEYFRLSYMLKAGGFYVDADEVYQSGKDFRSFFSDNRLKLQLLCYDILRGRLVKSAIFLKNGAYLPNWVFYVNTTPIITPPGHPVIKLALERATSILLSEAGKRSAMPSTTGTKNLTASVVKYWNSLQRKEDEQDFDLLSNWESFSISKWPLSYRNDDRNWRIWDALMSHPGSERTYLSGFALDSRSIRGKLKKNKG